jgi:hypothetical protein
MIRHPWDKTVDRPLGGGMLFATRRTTLMASDFLIFRYPAGSLGIPVV